MLSARTFVAAAVLAAPLILGAATATSAQTRTVTAMWDRNTDGVTIGYVLSVGTQSGTYSHHINVGNATSHPLTLNVGATYFFVVRGVNAAGQTGPASSEVAFHVSGTTAPTAHITASLTGNGSATVTWSTTHATSATINGIAVPVAGSATVGVTATTTYTLVATGPGGTATASATVTIANPVDCLQSAWRFSTAGSWGSCSGGQRGRAETWIRSVLAPAADGGAECGPAQQQRVAVESCSQLATTNAPAAPVNLSTDASGSRVTLSWNRSTAGGTPTRYFVSAGRSPGSSDLVADLPVGNAVSVAGNLAPGVYYARVRAANGMGFGPLSGETTFRVGATGPPRRPLGLIGSFHNSVATLSWTAPAGPAENGPTAYVVEAGSAPGLSNLAVMVVGNATRFQTLAPPGVYHVRVRAVNALGVGPASNEIVVRAGTGPGAPASLTSSIAATNVTFSWQAPPTGVPDGYLVEIGTAPVHANRSVQVFGNVTSVTLALPPGVHYVRVRGWTQGTAGPASNEIVVRR
jgi:titin